jgi:hypothetical protein
LALLAACGGKMIKSDGEPGTGSSGSTTGGGGVTTVAPDQPPIDVPPVVTTTVTGGGSVVTAQPCGTVVCGEGMVCCNAGCGICAPQGQGCPQIGCPIAVDASGAGGSPIPPEPVDIFFGKSDFGFQLKDSWFISGCAQQAGHDCIDRPGPVCPNQTAADFEDRGLTTTETFPVGGDIGRAYAVSFKFNGITEGKFLQGGSWAQPDIDVATPGGPEPAVNEAGIANDTFYIGGNATVSLYTLMRMRVLDPNKKELARYYMNAYPPTSGAESHRTFLISYAHTIDVIGGGFVEFHIADSNCYVIDNCGAGGVQDGSCDAPRNIPNEPNVQLPAFYNDSTSPTQPHSVPLAQLNPVTGAKQPWHAQISHFTVTKIVAK